MALKPVGPRIKSQEINDNFSYLNYETNRKADVDYVDNQLASVSDGTPEAFDNLSAIQTAYPSGDIYVKLNLEDGYVYKWNGSVWEKGWVYQGKIVSDGSVGLDGLIDPTLITDYVKGNDLISLPAVRKGKYEINLQGKSDLYITNGNMFDLFKVPNGTYSSGGLTITINRNNIKVTGTSTSNLYARLSNDVVIAGNTNDAGLTVKNYKVPSISNFAYGFYNKIVTAPTGATFNIRNIDGGNVTSLPLNTTQQYANLVYSDKWGALYMYLPSGTYNVTFDAFLMANVFTEQNRISPSTRMIESIKRARIDIQENEHLVASAEGTAIPLVNVYENLQTGHSEQVDQIYVESYTDYFYYYIKGSDKNSKKYLRYRFEHFVRADTKADAWVQSTVDAVELVDGIWKVLYPVVIAGEWEMAVRIKDRPDFIGAKEHGSEINTYVKFYVDGVSWTPSTGSFWCNEIRVIQKSTMYDPLDETTHVGNHTKVFTINQSNLSLKQKIAWIGTFDMDMSYVTMLPIVRGNDAETTYQVTAVAYDDYNLNEIDISTSGHAAKTYDANASKWYLYSNSTGISAEVQSVIRNKPTSASTFIQNTVKYNKVYFAYCNTGYKVNNGDIWEWESIYKLNVK